MPLPCRVVWNFWLIFTTKRLIVAHVWCLNTASHYIDIIIIIKMIIIIVHYVLTHTQTHTYNIYIYICIYIYIYTVYILDIIYIYRRPIIVHCLTFRYHPCALFDPSCATSSSLMLKRSNPATLVTCHRGSHWCWMISLSYVYWLVVEPYPSEKWWTSSVGVMTFPIWWEKYKFMFQTTNQSISGHLHIMHS